MKNDDRTSSQSKGKIVGKTKVLLLFALILLGCLVGTIFFCVNDNLELINYEVINHGILKCCTDLTIFDYFILSFKSTAIILIVLYLASFSAISQPFVLIILALRGLAIGVSVSYVYSMYELKGLLITLLMIIPHSVVTSIITVVASREALRMAGCFTKFAFSEKCEDGIRVSMKTYVVKFLILMVALLIASTLDCLIIAFFRGIIL